MVKNEDLLPIGTIVLLKGGKKKSNDNRYQADFIRGR